MLGQCGRKKKSQHGDPSHAVRSPGAFPMSYPHSKRGAVDLAAVAIIGVVLLVGGLFWKTSHLKLFERGPSASQVQKEVERLRINQAAIDAAVAKALEADRAAHAEQTAQTRTGQTFVAGTGQALAGAGAAAKADPAVQLAGKLNAKAGEALEAAVGPLTQAQADWVAKLIADATSASEARRAAAEQALAGTTTELRASESRELEQLRRAATAEAERDQLREADTTLRTKLTETLTEKDRVGALLDTVLHYALYAAIAYAIAAWLLPLIGAVFPVFKPIATAVHAVIAPLGAKALSEARDLARDASAALHNVVKVVEEKAPAVLAEVQAKKAEWITQTDGTAARHEEALREAQQI